MRFFTALAVAATTLVPGAAVPERDKPILEIVTSLEKQGFGPFVEVSLDDRIWEVEVYKGETSMELAVDPASGKILSEHRDDAEPRPPKGSLKLSEILDKLEQSGRTKIDEASFERRYWEVEAFRDDAKYELHVDPKTGEVISERLDD